MNRPVVIRTGRRYDEDSLRSIVEGPPSTIVIAEPTSQVLLPDSMVERPAGRLRVFAAGLHRTGALADTGVDR